MGGMADLEMVKARGNERRHLPALLVHCLHRRRRLAKLLKCLWGAPVAGKAQALRGSPRIHLASWLVTPRQIATHMGKLLDGSTRPWRSFQTKRREREGKEEGRKRGGQTVDEKG